MPKHCLLDGAGDTGTGSGAKVFWFFFLKKNRLLKLA
jgi:hypothetical protein